MSAYHQALEDVHALLDPPTVKYEYWEKEVADKKLFYVRGFTAFRREVCRNITDLNNREYIAEMDRALKARETWLREPYPWHEAYGWKQAYHASQRYNRIESQQPINSSNAARLQKNKCALKFHKAAQTILLCEVVARLRGKNGEAIYDTMRIQPACAYIHEFTSTLFESLRALDPEFAQKLLAATGQNSIRVFEDMSKHRLLVTYQLAVRTHTFITGSYNTDIGAVGVRLDAKYLPHPSIYENIEVDYSNAELIVPPLERGKSRAVG